MALRRSGVRIPLAPLLCIRVRKCPNCDKSVATSGNVRQITFAHVHGKRVLLKERGRGHVGIFERITDPKYPGERLMILALNMRWVTAKELQRAVEQADGSYVLSL